VKFNLLCVDCPWSFSDKLAMSKIKRGAKANYSTMTNTAIKQLRIPELAEKDAVLALWVPSTLLQVGLDVMLEWGFAYKQNWIWVKTKKDPLELLKKEIRKKSFKDNKNKLININDVENIINNFDLNNMLNFGMGHIARNTHEICLIGTKGKLSKFIKNKSQRTVLFEQNFKHSKKPEILQDRLELIFPDFSKKLEVFGRRERQGWTVIGNEVSTPKPDCDIVEAIDYLIKL
jgi:N6-adenosine-specific RNA methylase IME4